MEIDDKKKEELYRIINESENIVFFGGAGISTASGIPDFRGANGLYNYTPEEIISHTFFENHTKEFYEFYFSKMVYRDALPNECHKFLALLEKTKKLSAVITQNIDSLHQKAGSSNVVELHGSVYRNYCTKCGCFYSLDSDAFKRINYNGIPKCEKCGCVIKPDVVLYEEALKEEDITRAIKYISSCDTLIVAGTSLVVYPAASFIRFFRGKNLIVINLGKIETYQIASLEIDGKVEDYLNTDNFYKYIGKSYAR